MAGRTLKAGVVTLDPYNKGGIGAMMTAAYHLMEKWGFDVDLLYTLRDPPLPGQQNLMGLRGQHVNRLSFSGFAMPSLPLPFWLWTLTPILYGRRVVRSFDVIMSVCGSAHGALLPALLRLPYVMWVATVYEDELRAKADAGDTWSQRILTGTMWPIVQAQERLALRRASQILAISPYTVDRIKTLVPEVADRVELVSVPVDTDYFTPDKAVRDGSVTGDYLLLTARINDPRKNVSMLLHAFKTIHERFPDLRLVLAGDEPDRSIQTLVDSLGLADVIDFPGMVTRDELRRLYQGAQLFTLSSKQEGLGIVVMEAMACGTPVVSTRCGGPEGVIVDGETGRLVPNDDAVAFAQPVIDILSQPDELSRMQQSCVAYAHEHFATATVERQLFAAMQRVFPEHTARLSNPPVMA